MFQLGNITNLSNLLASELDALKNRILSEEFANRCWDAEFYETCQEDFEWGAWLSGRMAKFNNRG
jgi:hypothetical protein